MRSLVDRPSKNRFSPGRFCPLWTKILVWMRLGSLICGNAFSLVTQRVKCLVGHSRIRHFRLRLSTTDRWYLLYSQQPQVYTSLWPVQSLCRTRASHSFRSGCGWALWPSWLTPSPAFAPVSWKRLYAEFSYRPSAPELSAGKRLCSFVGPFSLSHQRNSHSLSVIGAGRACCALSAYTNFRHNAFSTYSAPWLDTGAAESRNWCGSRFGERTGPGLGPVSCPGQSTLTVLRRAWLILVLLCSETG